MKSRYNEISVVYLHLIKNKNYMARSNSKTKMENPVSRYYEWKSSKESCTWFNKETKTTEVASLPMTNLVYLEDKYTVSGWCDEHGAYIKANEVTSTKKEPLSVYTWKDGKKIEIAEGLYGNIKETVRAMGGHFTQSVYCMTSTGDIVNFQFSKSSRSGIQSMKIKGTKKTRPWEEGGYEEKYGENNSGWSNFWDNHRDDIIQKRFSITKSIEAVNGSIKYNVPWFEIAEYDPSQDELIAEKETEILAWLDYRKAQLEDTPDTEESVIEVSDSEI
jgi:hypothetical protein